MVANGVAMQAIMQASQEETKISRVLATKAHKLSESMQKDSLSMRTVSPFSITLNDQARTDLSVDSGMHDVLPAGDVVCSHSFDAILQRSIEKPV